MKQKTTYSNIKRAPKRPGRKLLLAVFGEHVFACEQFKHIKTAKDLINSLTK